VRTPNGAEGRNRWWIEQPTEQRCWLAKRSAEALESLRGIALVWSVIGGLALLLWLIVIDQRRG
jgi:hypothetical protein